MAGVLAQAGRRMFHQVLICRREVHPGRPLCHPCRDSGLSSTYTLNILSRFFVDHNAVSAETLAHNELLSMAPLHGDPKPIWFDHNTV
jgi:hypothetical protein